MGQMYLITVNAKSYIGISTVFAKKRWNTHINPKNDSFLSRAIRKYGVENTVRSILAECDSWEELCELERQTIAKLKTKYPHGYNMTDGGDGALGYSQAPDQRAAQSARAKQQLSTPEARAESRERMRRRWASPEARAVQSELMRQQMSSPVVRANLSEKGKQRFISPEALAAASAKAKIVQNRPEVKAANRARALNQWASPEARQRLGLAVATARAKEAGRAFSYIPRQVDVNA